MGAECSFYVKSIGTCALTFFGYLYYFSLSQCEPAHFCFIKCSKRIQDFIRKTLLFTKWKYIATLKSSHMTIFSVARRAQASSDF